MRITILGAGYVGLVTAAALAEVGHTVTCVDIDRSKVSLLSRGDIPFYEPGLAELVRAGVSAGRLRFKSDTASALIEAEVAFIAVGTPPRLRDGEADLTFVLQAADDIIRNATCPITIVTKSTVPVGTGDIIERRAALLRPDLSVSVVSNPEFLREGSAVSDVRNPDRIVVGAYDDRGRRSMRGVYASQIAERVPFLETERRTAELIKYAANAFLATKIAFANEIADLCEQIGSDVDVVTRGMGLDSRIGVHFLKAGPGYGGSCFPKDTLALLRTAQDFGVDLRLVQETVAVNDARKRRMGRRVLDLLGGDAEGKTIAILGLAFKADTDDMRESPAIPLIESLQRSGATIKAYDPHAMRNAERILDNVIYCTDAMACLEGADAGVFVTDWRDFRNLDLAAVAQSMRSKVVVDLRNMFDPEDMERNGFLYSSIGNPIHKPAAGHMDDSVPGERVSMLAMSDPHGKEALI